MTQKDSLPLLLILFAVNVVLLAGFVVAFRWLRSRRITLFVGIAMGICGLFILLFGGCSIMLTGSLLFSR